MLDATAIAAVSRFLEDEEAPVLSNMLMDLDYARAMGLDTEVDDALRLLRTYTLQLADLPRMTAALPVLLQRQRGDVAGIVRDVERMIRLRFERIPCALHINAEPVYAAIDPGRIFRVLYILLETANTSTTAVRDDDGVVGVAISVHEPDTLAIEVYDNGSSVPDELLPTLCMPGVRRTPDVPGSWSLYYAAQIIAAHEGTIHITNQQTGGLRVCIRLPLAD